MYLTNKAMFTFTLDLLNIYGLVTKQPQQFAY